MPVPTVDSLIGKLLRRCPLADYFLALDWLEEAFRVVWERREWSWRRAEMLLRFNQSFGTGTASITRGTQTVGLAGATIDANYVGRQWRPSVTDPIFTITDVAVGGASFTIDQLWPTPDLVAGTYEIYNAFVPVASDCQSIITATNSTHRYPVDTLMTREELDGMDPQRSCSGPARHLVLRDYAAAGAPRYEAWPHMKGDAVISAAYSRRMPDLSDAGATLPPYLTEDVLLQLALAECAGWPGYEGRPNPYYRLGLVEIHQQRAERLLVILEVEDQNRIVTDYTTSSTAPGVIYDDGYHQSHDAGWD